ncbi:MAG TPA: hypothetical protein VF418_04350 [Sphingomonadaceae bacterium]
MAHRGNPGAPARWVRINAIGSSWWREDLAAVMRVAPHGIMLSKCGSPDHLRMLLAELYEVEQPNGICGNTTMIMPLPDRPHLERARRLIEQAPLGAV